jgi:RHS repeat-associated protein
MKSLARIAALFLALLMATVPITFAAELRLTYDANGNLVTGDGKYRVYNSLNQLSAVYNGTSTNGTLLETYVFHPTEERVLKKVSYNGDGRARETTYYISQTFITIINASGRYDFAYIYHNGQLVAQRLNGSTLYIAPDAKGSTSVVMNASGAVLERDFTTPFGAPLNSSIIRYGYEGKEADSLVGDTDFHARKYKADWGIFSSPDSLLPNVYDPQKLNHYSFERNSPLNRVDGNGHSDWSAIANSRAALYSVYQGDTLIFTYLARGQLLNAEIAAADAVMYTGMVLGGGARWASGASPSDEEASVANSGNLVVSAAKSATLHPDTFTDEDKPLVDDHYKKTRHDIDEGTSQNTVRISPLPGQLQNPTGGYGQISIDQTNVAANVILPTLGEGHLEHCPIQPPVVLLQL